MVGSPIHKMTQTDTTPPTTWSEGQLSRQVGFQPASSPTEIHRSKRCSVRCASSSGRSQDRSLYGSGPRRPTIPFTKQSIYSVTWQASVSSRTLPTQQRHRQATFALRDLEEPSEYPETQRLYGFSGCRECLFSRGYRGVTPQIFQQPFRYSSVCASRIHSLATGRLLVLHQSKIAANTIGIYKGTPSPLLLPSYRVVSLLPATGLDLKPKDLGRSHQRSQLCFEASGHPHAFVRRRPVRMLRHRSRSLLSSRNYRQDARRCRDYKISDERSMDTFSSSTRPPWQHHRLQRSRLPTTTRATLCYDTSSGTSSPLPSLDKPSTYLLKGFATLHWASSQRPFGHPARPLSPPQHLQLPRAIPPALVFDTAGDRRPPILATYVDLASRQHAHSLARRSDNGVNHRCFRQHWLRQHSGGAFRGTPRIWRLLDALGTTTNHSSQGAQGGTTWATREPTTHTRQAHSLISRQHQRCGLLDKIQLSQQALNGRALPHRTLATKAPNLARSALHPIRTQHCRPCVSSSQCRPLEPQATHAKFLAATSPTTFGAISRYRPICMPPISSRSSLLYFATRSSLSRVQWPPPGLVATTRRLSEPPMESPPSSFAQDASFSSQRSSSIPSLAAAVMVRRSRSLQQGYLPSPVTVHMCTPASPGQSRAVSTPRAGVKGHALRLCLTNYLDSLSPLKCER